MSVFSFLSKMEDDVSLVYDIASGTVGAALVKYHSNAVPEIIATYRASILFPQKPDSEMMIREMRRSLSKVSEAIAENAPRVKRIHYVFSSPWVFSKTRIIRHDKEKEIHITQSVIDAIIAAEERRFLKEENKAAFAEDFGHDAALIEHKAIQVNLNGYEATNPVGKTARHIEIPFFVSATSAEVLDQIVHSTAQFFNFRRSTSHSFTLLSYLAIRDIFAGEKSFLMIDINGELTDLGIVRNGVLLHTASFPLGTNSIARHIASAMHTSLAVATSTIQVYLDHKIDEESGKRIAEIFSGIREEWLRHFHNALVALGNDIALPRALFLLVSDNLGNFFAQFLRKKKFSQMGLTNESFNVVALDAKKLADYCRISERAHRDTFLMLEAIALSKILQEKKTL